jgi:hypothetical protein
MTAPTLTYGIAVLDDCLDITAYSETESGLTCAITADPSDVIKLTGTCDNAADEYAYYEIDVTNTSTAVSNFWALRYKTSVASDGLGARVDVLYDDATTETVFGATPQFSTTWKYETGTFAASKTIDKIRFYADDYPDTVTAGSFAVWYDFFMIFGGTFTFPHTCTMNGTGGVFAEFGNKIGTIPIFGRDTDIKQKAGRKNTTFTIKGDMIYAETGWGTPLGQFIIAALKDRWCWFTCDLAEMKVQVKDFRPSQDAASDSQVTYELVLEEYSYSDKSHDNWGVDGWLGK